MYFGRLIEGILEFILHLKPIVKEDLNKFLLRNEKLLIKKLSWAFSAAEDFGNEFRTKVNNGQIASLTAAKTEAAKLHRLNSNKYDRTRATRVMSVDRQTIVNNRNRREGEAEYQYRRRLQEHRLRVQDQPCRERDLLQTVLAVKRSLVDLLFSSEDSISIMQRAQEGIAHFLPGYTAPTSNREATEDLILAVVTDHLSRR